MIFASIRQLFARSSQSSKARRRPRKSDEKPLPKRVQHHWFFEQLESRLVPSTLTTGKTAYAPGQTAILTGAGFDVGENINLSVVRSDGTTYTATVVDAEHRGATVRRGR